MYKSLIKEAAISLGIDETDRNTLCPFCKGGDTGEKSFSITRKLDGILYNCYRGKCGHSGFIPSKGHSLDYVNKPKKFEPRYYNYKLEKLNDDQRTFLTQRFSLKPREIREMGIKYSRAQSRYVFPIFDRYGREAGCISRSYEGDKPKSLTYWWSDTPKLSFIASDRDSTTCCLVEDIVSGIRVSRFLPAVVLLGVGLNEEQVRAIRLRYDSVICALDADATAISIKHKKRHGIMFKNFCVAPLKKDFKDSTDEEILEVLYGTQAIECIPAEQRGVSASTINNK